MLYDPSVVMTGKLPIVRPQNCNLWLHYTFTRLSTEKVLQHRPTSRVKYSCSRMIMIHTRTHKTGWNVKQLFHPWNNLIKLTHLEVISCEMDSSAQIYNCYCYHCCCCWCCGCWCCFCCSCCCWWWWRWWCGCCWCCLYRSRCCRHCCCCRASTFLVNTLSCFVYLVYLCT